MAIAGLLCNCYKRKSKINHSPNHQLPITNYLRRMNFIVRILISTLAVLATSYLLPHRMVQVDGFTTAIILALVLAFLNSVVKPIFILLTIPATILSLGLFLLVINAVIILLADHFVDGFNVNGFWSALVFSIVLTIINSIFNGIKKRDEQNQGRSF